MVSVAEITSALAYLYVAALLCTRESFNSFREEYIVVLHLFTRELNSPITFREKELLLSAVMLHLMKHQRTVHVIKTSQMCYGRELDIEAANQNYFLYKSILWSRLLTAEYERFVT